MNKYDDIINKVIKSSTVKDWIEQTNKEFTVGEIASLVINSSESLLDKELFITRLAVDNPSDLELNNLQNEINAAKLAWESDETTVIVVNNDEGDSFIIKDLKTLKAINKADLASVYVELINIYTGHVVMTVYINDSLEITDFHTASNAPLKKSKYSDLYVNIQGVFKVGDVVKIVGRDDRFVVCSSDFIPDNLINNCDFFDSCVTVIPEDVLDAGIDYKEQIDNILSQRIHEIDRGENADTDNNISLEVNSLDTISVYHEHVNITLVEKI